MQNIETGYKPEFGLGAWFAGENAANTEAANEEELIKSFLANQRERQMQPIDVEKAQLGLDPARYESMLAQAKSRDPNYIPEQLRGQIGQMQTQAAAGEKAKTLLPFAIKAEQGTLENTAEDNSLMQQFKQIDGLIRQGGDIDPSSGLLVKFSPQQQQAAVQHRDSLMKSMMSTPKFAQDTALADSKYEAALTKQQTMNEAALERARLAAEARLDAEKSKSEKALSDKQLYAKAYMIVSGMVPATPEMIKSAEAVLAGMTADKIATNAALSTPSIDLGQMGNIPMRTPPADTAREKANAALTTARGSGTPQARPTKDARGNPVNAGPKLPPGVKLLSK